MNKLTKVLLEDLLDTKKTVAIYGGGFKPPTKGHFNVVEKALADFPEIDELKIYVGSGVRDGITQDESIKIWNIYKNYLSDKVDVEPSIAPVKSVLGYAKENPDAKVYWILGAREDDEEDLKDIASRTRSIDKYPNLEVKVISTKGGVSGTKTRKAIADNNKEQFFHLIPDVKEKEEIWNIVSNIQESVTPDELKQADAFADKQLAPIDIDLTSDHVLKRLTGRDSDVTLAQLIGFFKRLGKKKKEFMDFFSKFKEIVATDDRTNLNIPFINLANKAIAKTIMRKDDFETTNPKLVFEVGEANLKPYDWEETDRYDRTLEVRFTTDSETDYIVELTAFSWRNIPAIDIEFSARLKNDGGFSSKRMTNKGELFKVMATITDIVKHYTDEAGVKVLIYSPHKKSSDEATNQRGKLYRTFIQKQFPGVKFKVIAGETDIAILPGWEKTIDFEPTDDLINEGRYDSLTRNVVRDIMDDWKSQFDGSNGKLEFNEDYESGVIDFELYAVLTVKETKYGLYKVDGGADPLRKPAYLEIKFQVDPRDLPQKWEDIYMDLTDVVRHELEHMTQQGTNVIASKEMADDELLRNLIKLKFLPKSDYYKLEQEVDAMLQGMYLKAKKSKTPFIEVINDYFDKARVSKKDRQDILDLWRQRAKALSLPLNEADPKKGTGKKPKGSGRRLYTDEDPKDTVGISFKTKEDIVDTLNKASFKAKSHARQSQIINLIHQRVRAAYNNAKDPDTKARLKRGLDYIEKRKEASKEKTKRLQAQKENIAPNHDGKAAPYGSGYKKLNKDSLLEEPEEPKYIIYSDMDGVLTNFDTQFMKISDGIRPSEYERNVGKEGFWELIDNKGVGFWVGMPWMSDGKQYWDYIKEYNPILLSSPSRSKTSRLGKHLWVRNNIPGTKLILAQAKHKQNYARENRILIDDRPSNIKEWESQGGIGILHTSAANTIRQLKELGL